MLLLFFSRSVVSNSCDPMASSRPVSSVLHCLLQSAQTHVHWVSDAIQPSHPLSSPSPSALNLSQHQGLFQWVVSSHQVAKVSEPQLQHQSSHEYSGLISFKMDWLDLLAMQGTLKSLLQHQSSRAPILQRSVFFTVQLSHLYMATGKTAALTTWTFVSKVMSLLCNTLSRFVITFLLSSKKLLILWLQSILIMCLLANIIFHVEVNATHSHTALGYPVSSEHAQNQLHMFISGGSPFVSELSMLARGWDHAHPLILFIFLCLNNSLEIKMIAKWL